MIEEILSKRTNHSFFREDKIPEKKVIENILEQAHKLTPHSSSSRRKSKSSLNPFHLKQTEKKTVG